MPLPTAVVIGAMKCGTTALHQYLAAHPDVSMAPAKEVNFFFGPEVAPDVEPGEWWRHGQWHRGARWYASLFEADRPVRGESSPGYTGPGHPEVAARMAGLLPDARLVYLVRDPVDRAVSQWRHHVRDGTEPRPVGEALLDPGSEYLDRSRYHARLAPFLDHFARDQVLVVVQERLLADRRGELSRVYGHVGADPGFWHPDLERRRHVDRGAASARAAPVDEALRAAVWEQVGDDVARLVRLTGDDLPEWRRPVPA